jgi:glycosyltransferase involved in cell wall biosynthesis
MIEASANKSPFFTIITVCRNAGKLLERTMRSVLSQSFDSFEYLIKDGSSSDGSLTALTRIEKIRLISKPDTGIYDAMNQALEYSTGNFVCFMNTGDTFYSSETLTRVAQFIHQNLEKPVYLGNAFIDGKPKIHPPRFSLAFLYDGHICHQAVFVRRSLYSSEKGFNLHYRLLADRDFFMRVFWVKRIPYQVIPEFVCNYDLTGVTSQEKYHELKNQEYREIQRKYFGLKHRIIIWLYLHSLVRAKSLLKEHLSR